MITKGNTGGPSKLGGSGYDDVADKVLDTVGIPYWRTFENASGVTYKQKVVLLHASAAVAVNNLLMLDVADTTEGYGFSVKQYTGTEEDAAACIGIALEAATAAGVILVLLAGRHEDVLSGTVAATDTLVPSGTAGTVAAGISGTYAAGFNVVLGFALASDDGGTVDIMFRDQGLI